jgi:hypothetical protein
MGLSGGETLKQGPALIWINAPHYGCAGGISA